MTDRAGAGTLILGAGVAGVTTALNLRDDGYEDPVTLVGDEDQAPYSRPPLSKQLLSGRLNEDDIHLCRGDDLQLRHIRYLRGVSASTVDLEARRVLVGADWLPFEHLVIATGVSARRPAGTYPAGSIHTVRTVEDSRSLRAQLDRPGPVAVIGAGVLGLELAAGIRQLGHDVAVLGRSRHVRLGRTGEHLASLVESVLLENGVDLRLGCEPVGVATPGSVTGVMLADGSVVPATTVVAAVGSTPRVEALVGTDLDISDGVLCDEHGVAAPGVWAVGDVARWYDPDAGLARRVEHQATAIEQALAVARSIATGEPSPPIVPFHWTELFSQRIVVHGRLNADLPLTLLAGSLDDRRFVGATLHDGRPTGLVGWNMPREFRQERARFDDLAPAHR